MPSTRPPGATFDAEGGGAAKINDCLSKCGRAKHPVNKQMAARRMTLIIQWMIMDRQLLVG
jgi:hypothetical protein